MNRAAYETLGVQRFASDSDIRKAYHRLAKRWHPDKVHGDEKAKAAAAERFKCIQSAYELLMDKQRRSAPSSFTFGGGDAGTRPSTEDDVYSAFFGAAASASWKQWERNMRDSDNRTRRSAYQTPFAAEDWGFFGGSARGPMPQSVPPRGKRTFAAAAAAEDERKAKRPRPNWKDKRACFIESFTKHAAASTPTDIERAWARNVAEAMWVTYSLDNKTPDDLLTAWIERMYITPVTSKNERMSNRWKECGWAGKFDAAAPHSTRLAPWSGYGLRTSMGDTGRRRRFGILKNGNRVQDAGELLGADAFGHLVALRSVTRQRIVIVQAARVCEIDTKNVELVTADYDLKESMRIGPFSKGDCFFLLYAPDKCNGWWLGVMPDDENDREREARAIPADYFNGNYLKKLSPPSVPYFQ